MATECRQVQNGTRVPGSFLAVGALEQYFSSKVLLKNNIPIGFEINIIETIEKPIKYISIVLKQYI